MMHSIPPFVWLLLISIAGLAYKVAESMALAKAEIARRLNEDAWKYPDLQKRPVFGTISEEEPAQAIPATAWIESKRGFALAWDDQNTAEVSKV